MTYPMRAAAVFAGAGAWCVLLALWLVLWRPVEGEGQS